MISTTGFLHTFDSLALHCQSTTVEKNKGTIVFVHGLGEHIGRYNEAFLFFSQQGYNCFGYDQRGFGRSEGERGHVNSFADYVEDLNLFIDEKVASNTSKPIFVLGHSMGTIVVLNYALKYADRIQGLLIFSCPIKLGTFSANLGCFLGSLLAPHWLSKFLVPNLINPLSLSDNTENIQAFVNDPYAFKKVSFNWLAEFKQARNTVENQAHQITLPILINHGDADEIADLTGSEHLFSNITATDKTLQIYPGLKHELLNHTPTQKAWVLENTLTWLQQHS